MLIGVAVIAIVLSTVGRWFLGTYRQHQALRLVSDFGGDIYEFDIRASDPRSWLYRLIGYDPFAGVQGLEISSDEALTSAIEHAAQFNDIEILSFENNFTAAGLQHAGQFNKFPNLRVGEFMESSVDGEGLQHLAKWTNHIELFFNGCSNVTDASLRHLVDLPNLERLSLIEEGGGMVITDAGLAHVGRMRRLKMLMIIGMPQVTDAGLASLHGLTKLESLVIRKTAATAQGIAQLYQALPDCSVNTDVFIAGSAGIQQIVMWKIAESQTRIAAVTDPARIGKIRELIHSIDQTGQQIDDRDRNTPMPATLRLEFKGTNRTLYEVRLGNGALQRSWLDKWGWAKWHLPDEQEFQFLELLEQIKTSDAMSEE
jgi:hypothetical protein